MFLRQSTTQAIQFGPFLDSTDGITPETALTIAQSDMQLSKDGSTYAQKSAAGNATHDTDGWYTTSLSTTDTATVGVFKMQVNVAGATPVWETFTVVDALSYDALITDGLFNFDPGTDTVASVTTVATTTTNTDMRGTENAATAASLATVDSNVDAILVDTGTTIPAQITAQNDISVVDILTTQMSEAYAADGVAPTLAQALFLIQQTIGDFAIAGTTITTKQLDGSTTAATYTLDSGTSPTSRTRTG